MSAQRYAVLSLILIGTIVLVACGGGGAQPTPTPTAEPMPPTEVAPEPTSPPPTVAAAPPSPTVAEAAPTQEEEIQGEEVRFQWRRPLSTIEELEPILLLVEDFDGVIAASGSEVNIDITYDPNVTSVEELQNQLQQIGQPVEEPDGT